MSSRPESIVRFECLALLTVAGSVIGRDRQGFEIDLLGDLLLPALMLWLIVRIVRGRSASARVVYTALWVLLPLLLLSVYAGITGDLITVGGRLDTLLTLASIAQLIMLWTPSSSAWLNDRPVMASAS